MLTKPLIALTAFLALASSGFAVARPIATMPSRFVQPQTFFEPMGKKSESKAGIVKYDGSIISGTGYSVSHDGTGEYTLDVPAGYFKNCPVILVTPYGIDSHLPIPDDYDYETCGNHGEVKIQVRFYTYSSGSLQDNSFQFAMIDT